MTLPPPYHIQLSKRAAEDLRRIFAWVERTSPQNAPLVVGRILDAIDRLKHFPHRNVIEGQHPKLAHPVRSLPVESHIVFFRVIEQPRVVRVLCVRHGSRRRLKRFE